MDEKAYYALEQTHFCMAKPNPDDRLKAQLAGQIRAELENLTGLSAFHLQALLSEDYAALTSDQLAGASHRLSSALLPHAPGMV